MRKTICTLVALSVCAACAGLAADSATLGGSLGNLYLTSKGKSRSISPENFTGEKGKAGMATEGTGKGAARNLGQTWKVSPSVRIKAKTTFTMGEINGPGLIQQIWMTPTGNWRKSILRFYWDGEDNPSVEVPIGHFFTSGWGKESAPETRYAQNNSIAVCVNPGSAFNCYWPMPFRKSARVTMENTDNKDMVLYYQINYVLDDVPKDAGYFHAQYREELPLKEKGIYTILDDVKGHGQYVGTYLAWEVHSSGWWGEGEIKFFMDGDKQFPTICGTGTEDYFCGSYNFENQAMKKYQVFSTPYSGLVQVLPPDKIYEVGQQFGLYRWHIQDPVRFDKDLRVTIQALGWNKDGTYLQEQDNISSVAYWYQQEPHNRFPAVPPAP